MNIFSYYNYKNITQMLFHIRATQKYYLHFAVLALAQHWLVELSRALAVEHSRNIARLQPALQCHLTLNHAANITQSLKTLDKTSACKTL